MKIKLLFTLILLVYLCSCGGYNPPVNIDNNNGSGNGNRKTTADFSYQQQHPLTVYFSDKSTYSDAGVKWDFGDGTCSTERNPVHKYNSKGVYNITMYASSLMYGADKKTVQIVITEPTKCYVTGIVYENIPNNNEYYNIRFTDDYLFFETLYWYTDWVLLSSVNIPYTYTLKNKQQIDFSKSEYVMRLYQNSTSSGTGTQKASWSVYPSKLKEMYSEQTTGVNSNSKVTLLLEWMD